MFCEPTIVDCEIPDALALDRGIVVLRVLSLLTKDMSAS